MVNMLTCQTEAEYASALAATTTSPKWFAIHTRPRHEKKVAGRLADRSLTAFVPTLPQMHQWSDRQKLVDLPLFSCYVFVHVADWRGAYLKVLGTPGAFQWVRLGSEPTAIPDSEMDSIRSLVATRVPLAPYPYLRIGQRVRLRSGCLDGVEGILVGRKGNRKLVVSINLIQRSLAVPIEGYEIEGLA
jgi:transcription antitermination factor NusG